jgi:hypothetical protein
VRSALMILDLFGRMDAREARTSEPPPGADRKTLLEEMVLVTARGRVLLGFDAYRWLLPRMPALSWTWPLWYLPGVAWAGRKLYLRIARGRSVLARCEGNDACEVRPASAPH